MMAAAADVLEPPSDVQVSWLTAESAFESDPDLDQMAAKFDSDISIDPDRELNIDSSDSIPCDSDSLNSSNYKDNDLNDENSDESPTSTQPITNGIVKVLPEKESPSANGSANAGAQNSKHGADKASQSSKNSLLTKSTDASSDTNSVASGKGCSPTRRKNPFKILKKLTKFDKPKKNPNPIPIAKSEFTRVVVDKLPQVFVVKYLGHRQVTGVYGLHHVRKPVDEMVQAVRTKSENKEKMELPLIYVVISPKGLELRAHQSNKVTGTAPMGLMPIDFISYGVQDIKYWRVFTCIVVRELSSRTRTSTCHAFLCDSSFNGRKMALSLGAAFSMHSKKLVSEGKLHNFQVELRPPDELADAVNAEWEV